MQKEYYYDIYIGQWSFHDETIKYLDNDLYSLYQIMVKANKQIFKDYGVNVSDNITIPGLALRIFLKDFYHNNIPYINKSSIYRFIKKAYYGGKGKTEVYIPCGYNLYLYDVIWFYPYLASYLDMPGLECCKVQFYTAIEDLSNLFGFYYCSFEAPSDSY